MCFVHYMIIGSWLQRSYRWNMYHLYHYHLVCSSVPLFWGKKKRLLLLPHFGECKFPSQLLCSLSLSLTCEPHTHFTCYTLEGFVFIHRKNGSDWTEKAHWNGLSTRPLKWLFSSDGEPEMGLSKSFSSVYKWRTHPHSNRMERPMSSSTSSYLLLYVFQQDLRWRCCTVWGQLVNLHIDLASKSRCQRLLVPHPFIF